MDDSLAFRRGCGREVLLFEPVLHELVDRMPSGAVDRLVRRRERLQRPVGLPHCSRADPAADQFDLFGVEVRLRVGRRHLQIRIIRNDTQIDFGLGRVTGGEQRLAILSLLRKDLFPVTQVQFGLAGGIVRAVAVVTATCEQRTDVALKVDLWGALCVHDERKTHESEKHQGGWYRLSVWYILHIALTVLLREACKFEPTSAKRWLLMIGCVAGASRFPGGSFRMPAPPQVYPDRVCRVKDLRSLRATIRKGKSLFFRSERCIFVDRYSAVTARRKTAPYWALILLRRSTGLARVALR